MASTSTLSRLQYLDEARRLLADQSPAISAHLGAQHDLVARQNGVRLADSHRRGTCGACGALMIPDRSCQVIETKKAVRYCCARCHSYTIQSPSGRADQPSARKVTKPSTESKDANANSKKRARARKHGGLQAMLAKSKADEQAASADPSPFGLVDFMKTAG